MNRCFLFIILTSLLSACYEDKCAETDLVRAIQGGKGLAHIESIIDARDPGFCTGFSPIWYAQDSHRYDVVDALVASGWSYNEKEVGVASPEMIWSGYIDDQVSQEYLLAAPRRNEENDNALLYVCKHGGLGNIREMLEFFPANSTNRYAQNCAHMIAGRLDLSEGDAQSYIDVLSGSNVKFSQIDNDGDTALGQALKALTGKSSPQSRKYFKRIAMEMVGRGLVDVNEYGRGAPPIVHALRSQDLELVAYFIDHGARVEPTFCDDFERDCSRSIEVLPGASSFLEDGRSTY